MSILCHVSGIGNPHHSTTRGSPFLDFESPLLIQGVLVNSGGTPEHDRGAAGRGRLTIRQIETITILFKPIGSPTHRKGNRNSLLSRLKRCPSLSRGDAAVYIQNLAG